MRRFYERSLLYDPHEVGEGQARRVDIGTSLATTTASATNSTPIRQRRWRCSKLSSTAMTIRSALCTTPSAS